MSTANTSRMALLYSARLSRWAAGLPGFGLAAADLSKESSSHLANDDAAEGSGCGMPAGGISPERTLRRTRSRTSAWLPTLERSTMSSATPPVFSLWLWQPRQYLSSSARDAAVCCALATDTKNTARTIEAFARYISFIFVQIDRPCNSPRRPQRF